jgi:hypothetical protein
MAEKVDKKAGDAKPKKTRQRSPNYPTIGLRDAVTRARKLYDADGKAGSSQEAAYTHIGFSGPHGQAQSVMSAIKKFAVLEDKKDGRIAPTKLAIDVFEFPPEHERHRTALREMVLSPAIYSELVNEFRKHSRLPSDATLKSELAADWDFNPAKVDGFLKDFRDSLTYAGLLDGNDLKLSDTASEEGGEASEGNDVTETLDPPKPGEKLPKPLPPVATGLKDFPLYTSGPKGALYAPATMSKADFELFKKQLESYLLVIEATSVVPDQHPN